MDDINGKIRLTGYKEGFESEKGYSEKDLCLESSTGTMKVITWQNAPIASKATAAFVTRDELCERLV